MTIPGFTLQRIPLPSGVTLRVATGGEGPAVVLLHGHPRTHATWHRVAPALAGAGLRVICPDLRGYGQSTAPEPSDDLHTHSDRTMAEDIALLMTHLGHDHFSIVGHDRGSYVAYRTALDLPERVDRLAVLDCVPILEALERADAHFAEKWWHWFFFASPHAERVICADPLAWYKPDAQKMGQENYQDMVTAISDPQTVGSMTADYRASLHVDRAADAHDRERGHQIQCPTLVAWAKHDDMEDLYGNPAEVWASWCAHRPVSAVIDSGHHMAEDNPKQLATVLTAFLLPSGPLRHD
ncbi:alpha/beta hydrolase [Micrococcus sp. 2A]|uniref:alpha/beta fold hydrolase n=1 Tax=Micrococcus sp. 2A TaxID=3142261 RepID=UPI0026168B4A|nr:alpha/beta hydrolase [uncultured Micrococcus sp.]